MCWPFRFLALALAPKPMPPTPNSGAKRGKGGVLHLRDIRCLQGVSEPALLVRRDAIVVSLDPIKAIITCETAFLVVQEGNPLTHSPMPHHVLSLFEPINQPQISRTSTPTTQNPAPGMDSVLEPLLARLREGNRWAFSKASKSCPNPQSSLPGCLMLPQV